jgi:N-acetylglucosaminyldiphosphoundecaprenol N-acetyl-beta-D-mannosaminyltransferase
LQRYSRKKGHYSGLKKFLFIFPYYFFLIINRVFESAFASLVVIFLFSPFFLIFLVRKIFAGKDIFLKRNVVGQGGRVLGISFFQTNFSFLSRLPLFLHVLTGKLALVGPDIRDVEQVEISSPSNAYIRMERPGIFSLWYIRKASKIAHEGRNAIDWEYVFRKNLLFDFFLLLRTVPAFFFSSQTDSYSRSVNLFGLHFLNMDMEEAVELIDNSIKKGRKSAVYFVNPDCFNKIFSDKDYFEVLKRGEFTFPDGIGVNIACKLIHTPLKQNINGTDLFPFLCNLSRERNYSIFLLGGRPGVAEKMAKRVTSDYNVKIAGFAHGYFHRLNENKEIIDKINMSGARILLVAFGAPLQEKWIDENLEKLRPEIAMGVGGLFDFFSGNIKRAPRWMREMGIEWIYRIMQEPGRMWRRYVMGNPLFLYRVMRWKLFSSEMKVD